ncbi:MAG TPA: hypothetical protein VFC19_12300 [Candidatus Limnocylindrales bacterium]|nr:hypothetical protein [Candidatus Limnocylindrales bacterium]
MSVVSAARYIGWLLHVNRRYGPDEALRSGRTFAKAFRGDQQPPLAPSQVTRWENGQLIPDRDTIRRYEQLLGLASESLITVAEAIVRSAGNGAVLRDRHRPDTDDSRERLYELLDRVTTSGPMSGADWSTLTGLTTARPHLELYPPRLWRDIADRLLRELVAAAGSQWLQRQEAMSRLLVHPSARPHAVAACVAMASDPSSAAVIEPLPLLDITGDMVANSYVLRQIEHPDNDRALQGALRAAIRKVGRGRFKTAESRQLVASISRLLNDPTVDSHLLPLVVEVARRLAQQPQHADTFARHLQVASVTRGLWMAQRLGEPEAAQVVSTRLVARAQSQLPDQTDCVDTVFSTLVEESLFLPDPDRSLVANMLIAATPYQVPFSSALLDEIKSHLAHGRGTCSLAAGLSALTQIGVDIHRPLINSILSGPGFDATTRYAAAWATPFCAGRFTEHEWRQILAAQLTAWQQTPVAVGESILQAITYGVGTDGHHGLLAGIRDHPSTPAAARTLASWLLRTASPVNAQ